MACHDAVKHHVIRDLVTACLYHRNQVCRGGNGKGQIRLFSLLKRWVQNDLAVHKANIYGRNRAVPRNIGNRDRGGNADSRRNFRRAVRVNAHNRCNNGAVVSKVFWEERADRSVYAPACQNSVLACSALTAQE